MIKAIRLLSKLLAVHCYRNTIIEDYHANGFLDNKQMCELNKEVCNKIYTFLLLMQTNNKEWKRIFLGQYGLGSIVGWDNPKKDKQFMNCLKKQDD